MVEYSRGNIKLTNTQLKKLNAAIKNKTGTTLRMTLKIIYHTNYYWQQDRKQNKHSCNGPPAFKQGSCRLRFS